MVTLVWGPPCAGKTTWAHTHAQPGDRILDLDEIARTLGSPHQWDHDQATVSQANLLWWQQLGQAHTDRATAWAIRCVPTRRERHILTRGGRWLPSVLLLPDQDTLYERALLRPDPTTTIATIRRWYSRYQPDPSPQVTGVERASRAW